MINKIMDMIHFQCEDDPALEAEVMAYIANMGTGALTSMSRLAIDWLEEHGRCVDCGATVEIMEHKEYHPECGPGVYETLYEPYCPVCDGGMR